MVLHLLEVCGRPKEALALTLTSCFVIVASAGRYRLPTAPDLGKLLAQLHTVRNTGADWISVLCVEFIQYEVAASPVQLVLNIVLYQY